MRILIRLVRERVRETVSESQSRLHSVQGFKISPQDRVTVIGGVKISELPHPAEKATPKARDARERLSKSAGSPQKAGCSLRTGRKYVSQMWEVCG